MRKPETADNVLDKMIFSILVKGSAQNSTSSACKMLRPLSLEGEKHKTSPIFDDVPEDRDLNQAIIHRLSQEHFHGLSFSVRRTEVRLMPVTSEESDSILLPWRKPLGKCSGLTDFCGKKSQF